MTITRKQCEELIEMLTDKSLTFGCEIFCEKDNLNRVLISNKKNNRWWLELSLMNYREKFPKYLVQTDEGTLGLGDGECADYQSKIEILGHPILKCHVENRLQKNMKLLCSTGYFEGTSEEPKIVKEEYNVHFIFRKLAYLWAVIDVTASLQNIFEGMEFEDVQEFPNVEYTRGQTVPMLTIATPSKATDLFDFLINLFFKN